MVKKVKNNFDFKKEAIYRIVVKGIVDESWSERLSDMQIRRIKKPNNILATSLIGEIRDQSALSGVLNSLYDMQLTVISVNMLSEIEGE